MFSKFRMETPQSVLRSVQTEDWMVSIDLQDVYLQIPVHQDSCRYLRFVVDGQAFQFWVLCFGLTTAPQVFTRVMAPVSAILHRWGFQLLQYLDNWLVLGSSLQGSNQGNGLPVGALLSPGHSDQSGEVEPLSLSMSDLFRDDDSVGFFEGFPDCREAWKAFLSTSGIPVFSGPSG